MKNSNRFIHRDILDGMMNSPERSVNLVEAFSTFRIRFTDTIWDWETLGNVGIDPQFRSSLFCFFLFVLDFALCGRHPREIVSHAIRTQPVTELG